MIKSYIPLKMNVTIKAKLKSGEYILTEKIMLKVKYGNRFVKYKMQVARVIFGFGSSRAAQMFGFGSGRVAHTIYSGSGRVGPNCPRADL
jgi:hypothetical protein